MSADLAFDFVDTIFGIYNLPHTDLAASRALQCRMRNRSFLLLVIADHAAIGTFVCVDKFVFEDQVDRTMAAGRADRNTVIEGKYFEIFERYKII